ncbi:hypothetical protein ACPC54_23480 [Kitasatospora sp. NPDC094028]
MRMYSRTGATVVDDPEHGRFEAGPDGSFDFPDDLSDRLRRFHVGKQRLWEDAVERQDRQMAEQLEQAQNPATLMSMVAQLTQVVAAIAPAAAQSQTVQEAPTRRGSGKRAATASE